MLSKFIEPLYKEKRPKWELTPKGIILKIEEILKDRILSGEILWGGFSNSAIFKITTDSGKSFFVKGSHPDQDSHGIKAIEQEIEIHKFIPNIEKISPRYICSINDGDDDGWALAIFEFIENKSLKPWTEKKIIEVFKLLNKIHSLKEDDLDKRFPKAKEKNYIKKYFKPKGGWLRIEQEDLIFESFLSLFEEKPKGRKWLNQVVKIFSCYQLKADRIGGENGVIHQDLRSDNILLSINNGVYLVDLVNVCYGPIIMDLVSFLPSISSESNLSFNELLLLYERATARSFNKNDIILSLISVSGHLADNAYRDIPKKLPRLRWMQKKILWEMLQALSSLLDVPKPPQFTLMNKFTED